MRRYKKVIGKAAGFPAVIVVIPLWDEALVRWV
jgi:hypothetical protein